MLDPSMPIWLDGQLKASKAQPSRVCFQVTEDVAANYQTQVQALARAIRQRGLRSALETFGSGRDPEALLESVALDFVKIDGALIQGLSANSENQLKVKQLVETAIKNKIETIAERVEEANTMAILWQLGVQFVQGYFVNEPEQVVMGLSTFDGSQGHGPRRGLRTAPIPPIRSRARGHATPASRQHRAALRALAAIFLQLRPL